MWQLSKGVNVNKQEVAFRHAMNRQIHKLKKLKENKYLRGKSAAIRVEDTG